MVAFFKHLFGADKSEFSQKVRQEDPQSKVLIATCAILIEVANSDDEFTEEERSRIVDILKIQFSLSDEDASELIEVAKLRIDQSIDMWSFTNTINEAYTPDEKIKVLEAIWKVIYADGRLSGHEDSLVHKLSFLLGLKHSQLIDAKLRVLGKK